MKDIFLATLAVLAAAYITGGAVYLIVGIICIVDQIRHHKDEYDAWYFIAAVWLTLIMTFFWLPIRFYAAGADFLRDHTGRHLNNGDDSKSGKSNDE